MTTSHGSVLSGVPAAQRPRILHLPEFVASTGPEAVELSAMAGLHLDPWQQMVLHGALGERPDGMWASFEVGVEVARQNGKGGILEAFALAGLFLLGEQLIIHSAHEFATAIEALERMDQILEGCPDLSRRVRTLKRSHGEEGVYLRNGQRLRYKTRTKGGGRGFTADRVILDEAMVIPEAFLGALMPTLSARPNPQLVYTGSAVDQETMEHGVVFSRLRERAVTGEGKGMAYFGWTPDVDHPDHVTPEMATDPDVWQQANPALGIRIRGEHIALEQQSMDHRTFAVERLGVGDWPRVTSDGAVLPVKTWLSLVDPGSKIADRLALVFDVTPQRDAACISVAGVRDDGLSHVEVIDHKRGTGWVVDRAVELADRHQPVAFLYDQRSPAASLATAIQNAGVALTAVDSSQMAQAWGVFMDAVAERSLRHLGTPELTNAIRGAAKRPLGDAFAWSRKTASADISPLVCVTLALWALGSQRQSHAPVAVFA